MNHDTKYTVSGVILNERLLEAPLTYDNYQDKFHTLLYYEELEQETALREMLVAIWHCFVKYSYCASYLSLQV